MRNISDELEEILDAYDDWMESVYTKKEPNLAIEYSQMEAKQAILNLIKREVNEARVDELRKYGRVRAISNYEHEALGYIEDRMSNILATLKSKEMK